MLILLARDEQFLFFPLKMTQGDDLFFELFLVGGSLIFPLFLPCSPLNMSIPLDKIEGISVLGYIKDLFKYHISHINIQLTPSDLLYF